MFADDSLLFCKASTKACWSLKSTLDNFCNLSGQLFNFHKSFIVFSKHAHPPRKTTLARQLNMLPKFYLGRYLGVFFSSFYPTKTDLRSIVTKMEEQINLWEAGFLSKARRVTLIQSNHESLPSYTCASTLLPSHIAKSIDSIHRKFFWRQNKEKNSTPLVAWDKICTPKSQGGLGLRKTRPMNQDFLIKLGWKILTDPTNIWVQLIRIKYLHQHSFFTCSPKP